jgi:hypothetical protein
MLTERITFIERSSIRRDKAEKDKEDAKEKVKAIFHIPFATPSGFSRFFRLLKVKRIK